MIEILLQDNIAESIVRNKHQIAPMAWAARNGCIAALKAFYQVGASLEEADEFGKTAAIYAKERSNIEIQNFIECIKIKKEQLVIDLNKPQVKPNSLVQKKDKPFNHVNSSYSVSAGSQILRSNCYYKALLKKQNLLNVGYQYICNVSITYHLFVAARQHLTRQHNVNSQGTSGAAQELASMGQLMRLEDVCSIKKPYLGPISILGLKLIPCFAELSDKKTAAIIFSARENIDATIHSYNKSARQTVRFNSFKSELYENIKQNLSLLLNMIGISLDLKKTLFDWIESVDAQKICQDKALDNQESNFPDIKEILPNEIVFSPTARQILDPQDYNFYCTTNNFSHQIFLSNPARYCNGKHYTRSTPMNNTPNQSHDVDIFDVDQLGSLNRFYRC